MKTEFDVSFEKNGVCQAKIIVAKNKDLLVRTEEDKMINEFKKYDKEHTRLVTISVSDFNELIKETNISIEKKGITI